MLLKQLGKLVQISMPGLAAALLLPACGFMDRSGTDPAETMSIAVDLRDVHRCSRISPEIQVTAPPASTNYYEVRLLENNGGEELFLGGGSWNSYGTGLIPEGALTRHYRGPCPPAGKSKTYTFVVSAMQRGQEQPLAVRIHRFVQE